MQSGSLYLDEFIFGDTGVTLTAASRPGSTVGSSPPSQGSKPCGGSMTGMRVCKSLIPSQASVVRMVQESMPSFHRSQSPAKVKRAGCHRFRLSWGFQVAPFIEA